MQPTPVCPSRRPITTMLSQSSWLSRTSTFQISASILVFRSSPKASALRSCPQRSALSWGTPMLDNAPATAPKRLITTPPWSAKNAIAAELRIASSTGPFESKTATLEWSCVVERIASRKLGVAARRIRNCNHMRTGYGARRNTFVRWRTFGQDRCGDAMRGKWQHHAGGLIACTA